MKHCLIASEDITSGCCAAGGGIVRRVKGLFLDKEQGSGTGREGLDCIRVLGTGLCGNQRNVL